MKNKIVSRLRTYVGTTGRLCVSACPASGLHESYEKAIPVTADYALVQRHLQVDKPVLFIPRYQVGFNACPVTAV